MKKIIIVTPHLSGLGGTETVLRDVVQQINIRSKDYQAQLYLLGGADEKKWLQELPFNEYTSESHNKFIRMYRKILAFYQFLRKERPDMVICIDTKLIKVSRFCRKLLRFKFRIVSWIHFSLFHEPMVNVKLLPCADAHFCISTGIVQQMKSLGIDDSKLYTIYNPVPYVEETIPRPIDKTIYIYIGRIWFEGQKRMKDLLTALSKLKGDWRLNVYGDGEDRTICQNYAEQLGINNRITWHGWVTDPWHEIKEATALILTSSYEGFGMVLTEAISRGVYCVSSDCDTGPRDIIKSNINGNIFPTGDINQLESILQSIVSREIQLPDQMQMKESIKFLYSDCYYRNLLSCINKITHKS